MALVKVEVWVAHLLPVRTILALSHSRELAASCSWPRYHCFLRGQTLSLSATGCTKRRDSDAFRSASNDRCTATVSPRRRGSAYAAPSVATRSSLLPRCYRAFDFTAKAAVVTTTAAATAASLRC